MLIEVTIKRGEVLLAKGNARWDPSNPSEEVFDAILRVFNRVRRQASLPQYEEFLVVKSDQAARWAEIRFAVRLPRGFARPDAYEKPVVAAWRPVSRARGTPDARSGATVGPNEVKR